MISHNYEDGVIGVSPQGDESLQSLKKDFCFLSCNVCSSITTKVKVPQLIKQQLK